MKQLNFGSTNGVPNDPNKTVVHCPEEWQFDKVWKLMGHKAEINFSAWKDKTAILYQVGYDDVNFYKARGYTILPAEEFIRLNAVEQQDAEVRNPFRIGDKVYHHLFGWGKIYDIEGDSCSVERDGKNSYIAAISSISFTEYALQGFSQERPKPEIKEGQLIYVRHQDHTEWLMRFFSHFDGDDVRYFLGQQKTGKTQVARQYSLTNPLEEK